MTGDVSNFIVNGQALAVLLKLLFVVVAGLYVVFAFVVTRQIKIMRTTLITSFTPVLRTLGYVHLGTAIMVFLLFLMVL